ncbi:MAG: hypothetical protein ACRC8P_03005 [Spiroplasma sp.]
MKNFLNILSTLTLILSSSSIISTLDNSLDMEKTATNSNNNYEEKIIKSLVPTKALLITTGDYLTTREEWAYTTIKLGKMKQEQIMGIGSTVNDSYTEHKVAAYKYQYASFQAGIHHGSNFRNYFFEDKVDSNWDYEKAILRANYNFNSTKEIEIKNEKHWATGTIKFLWYYDDNSNLLIDIVGSLAVGATSGACIGEGIASINLGDYFTIFYTN